MGSRIEIVGGSFDTLKLERAYVGNAYGNASPQAVVSGVECEIATRTTLLNAGVAVCRPLEDRLQEDWPIYVDLLVDGQPQRHWGWTDNADVLRAARRFRELEDAGQVRLGMEL